MLAGPVIEFLDSPPAFVSVGHDGLFPYQVRPSDEVYIIASRWSVDSNEHYVEIWLPDNNMVNLKNIADISDVVRVHKPGFLWHDRTRDIHCKETDRWLSVYGFTSKDPRDIEFEMPTLFAVLPGSPTRNDIPDLLQSKSWREKKDLHTSHRSWMQNHRQPKLLHTMARRYERDKTLVSKLKQERGSNCQICGFSFTKQDGTDYCEIHHLESLADGGLDVSSNMLVLCANCHRRFHYGNVQVLSHTALKLVIAIDEAIYSCVVG